MNMTVDDDISGPPPSFFKIIIDLHQLEIPLKFMKKHGHLLASSEEVNLHTSTGANWQVKLMRENNKVVLQHGWSKFVEFYSISHGQFLVFTYQPKSCFNVLIFNTITASEIEYPSDVINTVRACQKRKSDEFIDWVPTSLKREVVGVPATILGHKCYLTPDEKRKVDEYECRYPSFVVKLTPSNANFTGKVKVPIRFAREYLREELGTFKTCEFRLDIGGTGKKSWAVNCVASDDGNHVQFSSGWKDFAVENKLKMYDICIFELIIETMSLIVTIFPRCTTTKPERSIL